MIDHIGMPVSDVARSTEFYLKALAPLGISIIMEGHGAAVGFGANSKPFFWIGEAEDLGAGHVHVAFAAPSREVVDAFYRAAIAAGGKDNGKPGLRPHYHENYYGAFVLDFDGHNIEAVCHKPE
jgi:catechol 2,3-dioxygenase-like lactoylglutathione lyase family enzyme